jgi:cell division protein FtsN
MSGKPIKPHEHRREIMIAIVSAVILMVIGGFYLWSMREKEPAQPSVQMDQKEQIAAIIDQPGSQVSRKDNAQIIDKISQPPAKMSSTTKQQIINILTE